MASLACYSYPVAVSLQHRFGFRAMAITSAIFVTFSYLTTPLVPSANYLFLTYCIPQGLGIGFMDCLSLTILPEFFDKYIGLATGIRLASVATGSMICNYLFPILIESLGWKNTFYCFSSVGAALLFNAFSYGTKPTIPTDREVIFAKESDVMAVSDVSQPTTKRPGFLQDRGFQLIVVGCVPFFFSVGVPLMFMV
jgi:MFS family permease